MEQVDALLLKGAGVEEWVDVRFFRPLGLRLVRLAAPTRITADQITLLSLATGLIAGHLMVYHSVRLNLLGFGLFIVSDILDSADGQLARLRGVSTPFGRVLDGVSDNLRFLNLYLHLMVRLILAGQGLAAVVMVVLAGLSHATQSAAADFIRNAFLELGGGHRGELDLPREQAAVPPGGTLRRWIDRAYRDYVARQVWMFPASVELIRLNRSGELSTGFRAAYRHRQAIPVSWCALIAQNIRFLLLLVAVVPGHPGLFLVLTIVPLNLALVLIRWNHERNARELLAGFGAHSDILALA